jgi:hypothetical protein
MTNTQKKVAEELPKQEKTKIDDKVRSWLSIILSTVITLLGLIYLLSIPFGGIGTNRFGITEAIIFATILFFNSALIGRLDKLLRY